MPIVPVTFASLRTPQSVADNKLALLNANALASAEVFQTHVQAALQDL